MCCSDSGYTVCGTGVVIVCNCRGGPASGLHPTGTNAAAEKWERRGRLKPELIRPRELTRGGGLLPQSLLNVLQLCWQTRPAGFHALSAR